MLRILTALIFFVSSVAMASNVSPGWYHVSSAIAKASIDSDVRADKLAAFAAIESSFRTTVKNRDSSATGLFQFTNRTWRVTVQQYGKQYGLDHTASRHSAYANSVMGAEYFKENYRILERRLQRTPSLVEVYMAHLLSPRRAVAMASAPKHHNVADMYPAIAATNPQLFYSNGQGRTVRQFIATLQAKIDNALATYGQLALQAHDDYIANAVAQKKWEKDLQLAMQSDCAPEQLTEIQVQLSGLDTINLYGINPVCAYQDTRPILQAWAISDDVIRDRKLAA